MTAAEVPIALRLATRLSSRGLLVILSLPVSVSAQNLFPTPGWYSSLPSWTRSVALGDVDGDGYLDLQEGSADDTYRITSICVEAGSARTRLARRAGRRP